MLTRTYTPSVPRKEILPGNMLDDVVVLLKRPEGATVNEVAEALGFATASSNPERRARQLICQCRHWLGYGMRSEAANEDDRLRYWITAEPLSQHRANAVVKQPREHHVAAECE